MVNRTRVVTAALILACLFGCGTPTQPVVPTPAPTPTPTPVPAPTPTPEPAPTPEPPVENTAPPVRVTIRLYTLEDGTGNFIPNPDPSVPIPRGYWARLDVTAKDEDNLETNGSGSVEFHFTNQRSIEIAGGHTNQRRVRALAPAVVECRASLDGVRSNLLTLTFK